MNNPESAPAPRCGLLATTEVNMARFLFPSPQRLSQILAGVALPGALATALALPLLALAHAPLKPRSPVAQPAAAMGANAAPDAATLAALGTEAERSQFVRTGRYAEVVALCAAFQKTFPKSVRCIEFGRTPENRPMLALVASHSGMLSPQAAQKAGLPVVLIQGGIHAGEIDGKDAGFLALRELLQQSGPDALLSQQVLLFVPVFNVDGHERFGAWNRPNQRGPEQMGWRTTAQNINLNRDYVKADAPEMQAMLKLVNAWDPLAYIDLHVTDGAKFEHDVSVQTEPSRIGDAALQAAGKVLSANLMGALEKAGSLPRPFYYSFVVDDDPASGFNDKPPASRFSHGYFPLRNRFGLLVEVHSWKDYPARVRITHNTIMASLQQFAQHGATWRATALEADVRASKLASTPVPMTYKTTEKSRQIDFHGYQYQHKLSDISGTSVVQYDETKPKLMKLPLRDQVETDLTITAPAAGYLVPPAHAAWVALKLQQHGIVFQRMNNPLPPQAVQAFRASKVTFDAQSFEGHQRLSQLGEWKTEQRALAQGALYVPINQPKARLVMALLEPLNPDSLVAWGLFNNAYEQKEYMEAYVTEEFATKELAGNAQLAAEFKRKLDSDPAFAANPRARLEFFNMRHPSWDEQFRLYPVLRAVSVPPGAKQ